MFRYECTRIEKHTRRWVARYGRQSIVVDTRWNGADAQWHATVSVGASEDDAAPMQVPFDRGFGNVYRAALVGIEAGMAVANGGRPLRQMKRLAAAG